MLWRELNEDGTYPSFKEEVETMMDEEYVDNLKEFEKSVGQYWEIALNEYMEQKTDSLCYDKGIVIGYFYEEVVLKHLESLGEIRSRAS